MIRVSLAEAMLIVLQFHGILIDRPERRQVSPTCALSLLTEFLGAYG